jgi:vacuolar-type H+-ATPase subunit F/Vma7
MSTHLNWFKSNIADRLKDPSTDLKLELNPYPFEIMEFHDAANYTAKLISQAHNNIYIALSGGADSEYTLRAFQRNHINVTPIIVVTEGNNEELQYAYRVCKELDIKPTILNIPDDQYLTWYYKIVKDISGLGIYCIPSIVACEYAKEHSGVLVIGEHLIDTDKLSNKITPGANEWDFYNECFVGEEWTIPFFNYTVELTYAMIDRIEDVPLNIFKSALYGTELRPIMDYKFSDKFMSVRNVINRTRKQTPNPHVDLGSKEDFLNALYSRTNFYKNG